MPVTHINTLAVCSEMSPDVFIIIFHKGTYSFRKIKYKFCFAFIAVCVLDIFAFEVPSPQTTPF